MNTQENEKNFNADKK